LRREKLPYEGSRLTPSQSRDAIEKLLTTAGCKDLQWTMINGEYILKFALPIQIQGVNKLIGFKFLPPRIPKVVRQYNTKTYQYEKITINDDVTAFRVLFWYLKNKIIAIKTGLVSAEQELMANILLKLPNEQETTLGERLQNALPGLGNFQDFAVLPGPEPGKKDDSRIVDGEVVKGGS
jgi:hypothetical protein